MNVCGSLGMGFTVQQNRNGTRDTRSGLDPKLEGKADCGFTGDGCEDPISDIKGWWLQPEPLSS